MIRYINNAGIDRNKYDACVLNSPDTRIYARSWYLDAVTDNWGVLVLNDYEAVMPLPVRKKYGLNYVYQAPWIQQLGIFTDKCVEKSLVKAFLRKIPKRFVLVDYLFHSGTQSVAGFEPRVNYILKLNRSFDEIVSGFNSNRKRVANKGFTSVTFSESTAGDDFVDLYKQTHVYKGHSDGEIKLKQLIATGKVNIFKSYENKKLIAGLLWVKDKKRVTYLLPVATEAAKRKNIPTLLVIKLIERFQNTGLILDFEGSMVEIIQ